MGYAPVARITEIPDPPEAGTVISVFDGLGDSEGSVGDRFPEVPFVALMWPSQEIPRLGTNAEEPTVVAIDGDTLYLERGDPPVEVFEGMLISALRSQTLYSLDETVTLAHEFPATDNNVGLVLRTPQGEVGLYKHALTVEAAEDGGSAYSFTFKTNESGMWHYEWASDARVTAERAFFVRYSNTL